MAKIVNISEIHPTLGFTEFDILEKYRKSFNESELGKLHSVFPFECCLLYTSCPLAIILMIAILIMLFKDYRKPIIIFCCIRCV